LNSYERIQRQPEIITTGNAFKIILPNINDLSSAASETTQNFSAVERVINMSKSKKVISRKEVESELDIIQPTASRLLKQMIKDGLIIQEGKGKNTRYKFK
jgi:ATP-dependent DNA helicase RecG